LKSAADHLTVGPLDVDSSVLTRWGSQIEGGAKGYNPKNRGRASHHPLLAFVADWRLVANFWLRPGNTSSSNNVLAFLKATLPAMRRATSSTLKNSGLVCVTAKRLIKSSTDARCWVDASSGFLPSIRGQRFLPLVWVRLSI
jgi:hypothetical protein